MAVTAYKTPGTVINADRDGKAAWANPDNAKVSNDSRAICDIAKIDYSDWLRATNFGFTTSDVPSGATIDGIEVKFEWQAEPPSVGGVYDHAIYLRDSGGQTGDNKGTVAHDLPETDEEHVVGGAADDWNAALSDSDVRDSTFGVDLSLSNSETGGAREGRVDCISIRIHYTISVTPKEDSDQGQGVEASHLDKSLSINEVGVGVEDSYVFTITNFPKDGDSGSGVETSSVDYTISDSDSGEGIEQMPYRDFVLRDSSPGAVELATKLDRKLVDAGAGLEEALKRLVIKSSESGSGVELSSLLASIFNLCATPFKLPGTAETVADGATKSWNTPDYAKACAEDPLRCAICGMHSYIYSDWLRLTNFGFDIPEGAIITGIEVWIRRYGTGHGAIVDKAIYLRDAVGRVGDNKAQDDSWGVGMKWVDYGGSFETWEASLTHSDVNDSSFGIDIKVENTGAPYAWPAAVIDCVRIRVFYKEYYASEQASGADVATLLSAMIANDNGLAIEEVLSRLLQLVETGQGEEIVSLIGAVGRGMKVITYLYDYHNVNVFTRAYFKVRVFTARENPL